MISPKQHEMEQRCPLKQGFAPAAESGTKAGAGFWKKLGVFGFMFFLIKGLLWVAAAVGAAFFGGWL